MPFLEKNLTLLYAFDAFLQKFNASFNEVDHESLWTQKNQKLWQGSSLALTCATKKLQ
jgi:hypothetical protein